MSDSSTPASVHHHERRIWDRFISALRLDQVRGRQIVLAILFSVIVFAQASIHLSATNAGRPYETWDEMSNFNTAHVVSGPTAARAFRYGSLESFLQWIGIVSYEYFDPVGRMHPHIRFSNGVPASWDDPYLAFREKNWDAGIDYCCFRGADDHQSLFLSRQIHLVVAYGLILIIGLSAVAILGGSAIFLIAPLLAFTVTPSMYFQMTQSLPNAVNATVAFGTVLFAMLYCDQLRRRDLLISVGLLAMGMNFKPDLLIVAGAPGLALCFVALRKGLGASLRDAFCALAVGIVVTVVTRPLMLSDPVMDLRVRYHEVMLQGGGASNPLFNFDNNWRYFTTFLESTLLWNDAGKGLVIVMLGIFLATVISVALWRRRGDAPILLIGTSVALVAWSSALLRVVKPDLHHFYNGFVALLAVAAIAMIFAYRKKGIWRSCAQIALACFGLIWAAHLIIQVADTRALARSYDAHEGLDPEHNRNLASLEAVRLIKTGNHSPIILVDQHSYTDLRPFRLNGVDARYVNLRNFVSILKTLDPRESYLVIFSRGGFDRGNGSLQKWEGEYSPEMERAYFTYQRRLLKLPVAKHYPGTTQPILSAAPIEPKDEMFVSILKPEKTLVP